ncbi:ATP-binding protein [Candidatus Neomarinimicrobiota bacterium]
MMSKSLKNKTILAVDDKLENLKVLIAYLESSGFEIMVAQSGEEAFQHIEHVIPDIILLDILMPGIDGFEICRRLKTNDITKEIPVIFMTALIDTADKVKGFEVGAVDYLTKPLQHEEVLARVNAHMTIRELQQQLQERNVLLQHKNTQLMEVNATKNKFFSIIAHDLKNPLNTLLTYSMTLVENFEKLDTEKIIKGIEALNRSATRAYDLLIDLLNWARSHSGKMEYKLEEIDLGQIAKENIELLLDRATEKGIRISSEINEGLLAYSDKNMVSTVLRNLLTNAVKFTSKNGNVTLSSEVGKNSLTITVRDTGIGITEENINKLFRLDTFYRTLGSDNEKGTGLGLLLCKEFINTLNGEIWVESEIGKGSCFIFTLPTQAT